MRLLLCLVLLSCGTDRFTGTQDGSTSGDAASTGDGSMVGDGEGGRDCGPPEIMATMDPAPGFCASLMTAPWFCDDFGVPSEQLPRASKGWTEVVDYCSTKAGHRIVAGGVGRGRVYEAWQTGAGGTDLAYLIHPVTPTPSGYVIVPLLVNIANANDGSQNTRFVVIRAETNSGPIEGSLWVSGPKIKVHITGGGAMDVVPAFATNQWLQVQLKMHVSPNSQVDSIATWPNTPTITSVAPAANFTVLTSVSVRIGVVGFEGSNQTNMLRFNDVYAFGQ